MPRGQDDTGPTSLMQYRATKKSYRRPRSHSQPSPFCRRWAGSRYPRCKCAAKGPHWCPNYQKCPFHLKWGFGCCLTDAMWSKAVPDLFKMRNCVQGNADGPLPVQETEKWEQTSFLAHLSFCQAHRRNGIGTHRHTGTKDCPWKCKSVNLQDGQDLNVPTSLKAYHPR